MKITAEVDGDIVLTQVEKPLTEVRVRDWALINGELLRCTGHQDSVYAVTPIDGSSPFHRLVQFTGGTEIRWLRDDPQIMITVIETSLR